MRSSGRRVFLTYSILDRSDLVTELMTKHFLILAAFSCSIAGCAITPPGEVNKRYANIIEQRFNDYQLKPGDTLQVEVYGVPDASLNQVDTLILPDGKSNLFFMDNAKLTGMTVDELKAALRIRMSEEIEPTDIRIQVTPSAETVLMVGEFVEPGPVPLTIKMTLHEAISAAGGMKVTGDTDWALLRRPYLDPKHPDLFRIDLNDQSESIILLPGDQVVLSRTFLAGVVNYLREYLMSIVPSSLGWMVAAI